MTFFKRILVEKRVWLIPLALGIVANIGGLPPRGLPAGA